MTKLICTACKKEYSAEQPLWQCACGGLLDAKFTAQFPIDKIEGRKPTLWRYREAIPIEHDESIVSFDQGFTPLLPIEIKGKQVLIKQDQLFATGSYKDRGAAVLISKVKELGVSKVVEDSSGNAGCAVAAYCAKANIECDIYVPADNSPAKLIQIQSYGAHLHPIPGSREDTASAVLAAAEHDYYASHSYNPFFFHGTKTFAFEVCEQLGWQAPDTVIVPVGNGTLLLGCFIGFSELLAAGIIDRMPRLIAVQSASCNPLHRAYKENSTDIPVIEKKDTVAEGIAIAAPIRGKQIVEAVRKTDGDFIEVQDNKVENCLIDMCNHGYFIEPTAAATIAGVEHYVQTSNSDEVIVSVFTGHGLKSPEKILKIFEHA